MKQKIKEGDLYKTLTVFGHDFQLFYGYYDEMERSSPFGELIPIYPDFASKPLYTKDGKPFVTQMQDACPHFSPARRGEECHACRHYLHGDDLIGICACEKNHEIT